MSFWTFCCKHPQVYTSYEIGQFCGSESGGGRKTPPRHAQVDGAPDFRVSGPSGPAWVVDNEADWIALSDGAGVMAGGSLWVWDGPAAIVAYWKRYGKYPSLVPPMLIGDSGYTDVITSGGSGFAKKGTDLYAFGENAHGGNIGLGLRSEFSSTVRTTPRWRAKLSSPISSIRFAGPDSSDGVNSWFEYTKKPTVQIKSVHKAQFFSEYEVRDDEPGSGAEVECDWAGYVDEIEVTNQGSGYSDPPTATLLPSHEDDAGVQEAAVVEMQRVPIVGFSVISGGSGYTTASLVEQTTGASATAAIEGGQIKSWTLSSAGNSTVDPASKSNLRIVITGDGQGASAAANLDGSSVISVYTTSYEALWKHKPIVSFSGGGGGGAAAEVIRIAGPIKGIFLSASGDGYTHAPSRGLRLGVVATPGDGDEYFPDYSPQTYPISVVGWASISPSHVTGATKSPAWMAGQYWSTYEQNVNPGSTGEVLPFTVYNAVQSPATIISASLYLSLGREVPLTVSGASVTLAEPVAGAGEARPRIKVLYRSNTDAQQMTVAVAPSGFGLNVESPCSGNVEQCVAVVNVSDPTPGAQPYFAAATLTATAQWTGEGDGPAGSATSVFEVIDGLPRLKSMTAGNGKFQLLGTVTTSISPAPEMYDGPTKCEYLNIPNEAWVPPSIPEKARIYFAPSDFSEGAAYAEAMPETVSPSAVQFGEPVLLQVGGLYKEEPQALEAIACWPEPEIIPGSWSTPGGNVLSGNLGVSGGKLYRWGWSFLLGESATPVRIQQPCLQVTNASTAYQIPAVRQQGGGSFTISPPASDTIPPGLPTPLLSPFPMHQEWFFNSAYRAAAKDVFYVTPQTIEVYGGEYTQSPTVQWLGSGPPPIEISVAVPPPIEWVAVKDGMACDSAGFWYSFDGSSPTLLMGGGGGDSVGELLATQTVWEYDRGRTTIDTEVVGRVAVAGGVYAQVTGGGSGYNQASLAIPAVTVATSVEQAPVNEVLESACEGTVILRERQTSATAISYSTKPASTISLQTTGDQIPLQYRPLPPPASYRYLASQPLPQISVTGDGVGASAAAFAAYALRHPQRAIVPLGVDPEKVESDKATVENNFVRLDGWLTYEDGSKPPYDRMRYPYYYKDGRLYFSSGTLLSPLEISTDNYGAGYSEPPVVSLSPQPPGCPEAFVSKFEGRVAAIGVVRGGSGYAAPPLISLTGGGGGEDAAAAATIVGPVESISITNAGSGYRTPPRVSFAGPGLSASATARIDSQGRVVGVDVVSGGRYRVAPDVTFTPVSDVNEIQLTAGGEGYTSTPDVLVQGGGGEGATASCVVEDGKVVSVTVLSRGSDYDQPPAVVFVGGGCQVPATAMATLAAPGAGAQASARLDGAVLFVNVTAGGQDYTHPPVVVLSQEQNWKIQEALQRLNDGEITQAEYDSIEAAAESLCHARILGKVREVTVTEGGEGVNSAQQVKLRGLALGGELGAEQVISLPTALGENGRRFTENAFTIPQSTSERQWFFPPDVAFEGTLLPRALMCLSLCAASAERKSAAKNNFEVSRPEGKLADVVATIRPSMEPTAPSIVSALGELARFGGGLYTSAGEAWLSGRSYYSTPPSVVVEDECGSGAVVRLDYSGQFLGLSAGFVPNSRTYAVDASGVGYTQLARIRIFGGTPLSWGNPASATAVVQGGSVTAITIQNAGLGYGEPPTVVLAGGGGSGASAGQASRAAGDGRILSIPVQSGGSGYSSAPTVYIISNDKPFGKSPWHVQAQQALYDYVYPVLRQWVVEYAQQLNRRQRSITGLRPWPDWANARFYDFYDDNGYVEDVYLHWSSEFGRQPYDEMPQVTITGGGPRAGGAGATVHEVLWTDVFGPTAWKRNTEE